MSNTWHWIFDRWGLRPPPSYLSYPPLDEGYNDGSHGFYKGGVAVEDKELADLMGNLEVGGDEAPTNCHTCKGRGWIAVGTDSDTECHSCGGTGRSWTPDAAHDSEQRLRDMGG